MIINLLGNIINTRVELYGNASLYGAMEYNFIRR